MNFNTLFIIFIFIGCTEKKEEVKENASHQNSIVTVTDSESVFLTSNEETISPDTLKYNNLAQENVSVDSIIEFAQSLTGIPYLYASMDPQKGFDCSGFINYVFNHFKIQVPRSSRDFENFGETVPLAEIKKGDLILFAGTDSTLKIIGHIGITISTETDDIKFIHSTSGKAKGVTVSYLNVYYKNRFMKVIRMAEIQ